MINRGKVFPDVHLQNIFEAPRIFRKTVHGLVRPFSRTTGVGIMDKDPLEDRLDDAANGVMHDPVPIRGGTDLAGLAIIDREFPVRPRPVCLGNQLLPEAQQLFLDVHLKGGATHLAPLPDTGQAAGCVKAVKIADLFVKVAVSFHRLWRPDRAFASSYQSRPASFVFVRITPAQDRGSIDYYQHYPGFRETPASWLS